MRKQSNFSIVNVIAAILIIVTAAIILAITYWIFRSYLVDNNTVKIDLENNAYKKANIEFRVDDAYQEVINKLKKNNIVYYSKNKTIIIDQENGEYRLNFYNEGLSYIDFYDGDGIGAVLPVYDD